MGYIKTVDTEELFRVENEEGSSVTVAQEEEEGRILSIKPEELVQWGEKLVKSGNIFKISWE